jgi:hypothetical protein
MPATMEGGDFLRMLRSGARTAHDEISDLARLGTGCLFTYGVVRRADDDIFSIWAAAI